MRIAVTGASGFIGQHLLAALQAEPAVEVHALARGARHGSGNVRWHQGDLEDPAALRELMAGGGVLVHLAYPRGWTPERHLAATDRIADAARDAGLRRLVFCSTAVVAGSTREPRVTEATRCEPVLEYERIKLQIERRFADRAGTTFDVAVLRPTAVFGPGGRNLLKLATDLTHGSRAVNYARSSLYGSRRMNLVCVENVIGALRFLYLREQAAAAETFIVSDDDDLLNNFRDVEAALIRHLHTRPYPVSPVSIPQAALRAALTVAGRSSTSGCRVYDNGRLLGAGWRKATSMGDALERFAQWFRLRT